MKAGPSDLMGRLFGRRRWLIFWMTALAFTVGLFFFRDIAPWAVEYPRAWVVPLKFWVSDFMKWLINDADLGLFTFKEFTRSISWVLNWFLVTAHGIFAGGAKIPLNGDAFFQIAPISWVALISVLVLSAYWIRDIGLSILVGCCFLYLAVFGRWESAMVTLSSIVVAVPLGVAGGLLLAVISYRHPWFGKAISPVLDLMQTVPVFAYLVPVLFLFGFGPVAAMTATLIYAVPPMVRCTLVALEQVSTEIVEFGRMTGCSRRQLMWKVMIPAARPTLLVGLNQVIMLSLNMVIIASMIGAGGLGYDVLHALRRLAIGEGVEAGAAITLLAIALDRLSQAYAVKRPVQMEKGLGFIRSHPHLLTALAIIVILSVIGFFIPAISNYPQNLTITTGDFWEKMITWININFFDIIDGTKAWLLIHILIPVKRFLIALPWMGVVGLLA
ncbi:MAG: ABC transporter permease subunit, partial [Deltaproteobacteria bacterium]|nr:ABC transporter permease subunit [Deltaproteobacteria bacterium]